MPLKLRIVASFIIDAIVVGIIIGVCMAIFGCSSDGYSRLSAKSLIEKIQLEDARIGVYTGDVAELKEVLASVMSQYDQMSSEAVIRLVYVADGISFELQQVMWKLERSQARKLKAEQSLAIIDKKYYSTNRIAK